MQCRQVDVVGLAALARGEGSPGFLGAQRVRLGKASPMERLDIPRLEGVAALVRDRRRKDIVTHRITMQSLYVSACLIAGGFTLLPSRYLGNLVWHEWLGWV